MSDIKTKAESIVNLIERDTEFFGAAIPNKHDELDWLEKKRAQAHKFIDSMFDKLIEHAKEDLTEMINHTRDNGLVTHVEITLPEEEKHGTEDQS